MCFLFTFKVIKSLHIKKKVNKTILVTGWNSTIHSACRYPAWWNALIPQIWASNNHCTHFEVTSYAFHHLFRACTQDPSWFPDWAIFIFRKKVLKLEPGGKKPGQNKYVEIRPLILLLVIPLCSSEINSTYNCRNLSMRLESLMRKNN